MAGSNPQSVGPWANDNLEIIVIVVILSNEQLPVEVKGGAACDRYLPFGELMFYRSELWRFLGCRWNYVAAPM